eukprot:7378437-Prymnesium_polylepis.3
MGATAYRAPMVPVRKNASLHVHTRGADAAPPMYVSAACGSAGAFAANTEVRVPRCRWGCGCIAPTERLVEGSHNALDVRAPNT